jgi:hypothetical protein
VGTSVKSRAIEQRRTETRTQRRLTDREGSPTASQSAEAVSGFRCNAGCSFRREAYREAGNSRSRAQKWHNFLRHCEMLRITHCLDNRLIDECEVIGLMCWPRSTPQKDSWYSFLLEAESTPGPQCVWKD